MSTKRTSIAIAAALVAAALMATTAQARPYPAVDRAGNPVKAAPAHPGVKGHLPSSHHRAPMITEVPQAAPVARNAGSDGVSTEAIYGLMALALLSGALIAIWVAARTGHVTRERAAER
jgi:poly(3-hydroxybutyrate) depolymerase